MSQNIPINFSLSEEQKMIQKLAHDFAENEIVPVAEYYDKTHEYPWPVIKKAQELGFTALIVPEEFGGMGLNLFEDCLVSEELARMGIGPATSIPEDEEVYKYDLELKSLLELPDTSKAVRAVNNLMAELINRD